MHALCEPARKPPHARVHDPRAPRKAVDPSGDPAHAQPLTQLVCKGEAIHVEPVVVLGLPLLYEVAHDEGHLPVRERRAAQKEGLAEPVLRVRARDLADHSGARAVAAPITPLAAEDLHADMQGSPEGAALGCREAVHVAESDELVDVEQDLVRRMSATGRRRAAWPLRLAGVGIQAAGEVVGCEGLLLVLNEAPGPWQCLGCHHGWSSAGSRSLRHERPGMHVAQGRPGNRL
mmetsp:Transcript_100914/g.313828  ORF Transcript_100914/g.313828 Transcript_100914/m.313828 type:complete len:233 (+) Transcript_100914:716-1414(+)